MRVTNQGIHLGSDVRRPGDAADDRREYKADYTLSLESFISQVYISLSLLLCSIILTHS